MSYQRLKVFRPTTGHSETVDTSFKSTIRPSLHPPDFRGGLDYYLDAVEPEPLPIARAAENASIRAARAY